MNEFNEVTQTGAVETIDEGLRLYMLRVFNYMGAGLCLTALTAWIVANTSIIGLFFNVDVDNGTASVSALGWIITFAPLIMIFAFNSVVQNRSLGIVQAMFWAFSAVMGASLANVFILYTASSMTRVFLITAATFGGMSLLGYTTKKDLTSVGSFLIMGVWGLVIASIVNIFMQSEGLYYAISYIAVIVFTGLTAYDVQNIKNVYYAADSHDIAARKAIVGALNLYLDFINLFVSLLRIMGDRR